MVVVAVGGIVASLVGDGGDEVEAPSSPSPTPETIEGLSCPEEVEPAFAVWPETTPAQARAAVPRLAGGEDPWRAEPMETGLRFASDVFGWTDPVLGGPDPTEQAGRGNLVWVVRDGDGERGLVQVERLVDDRWWSVVSATSLDLPSLRFFADLEDAHVTFDLDGGEAATVVVGFGDHEVTEEIPAGAERPVDVTVPLEGAHLEAPGRLLVLLRDPDGAVSGFDIRRLPGGCSG